MTERLTPEAGQEATEAGDSDLYTREEYEAGRKGAENIAYLHMATAWIDRWKALGGDFNFRLDKEGQPCGLLRGMTCMFENIEPTDRDREDIPPHHDGAVKALEGLLELCPGLREGVREVAGKECFTRWARGQEAGQ